MTHAKAWLAGGAAILLGVVACSAVDSASALDIGGNNLPDVDAGLGGGSSGSDTTKSPSAEGSALEPTDNAIIIVHAAGAPAFRLCFENDPTALPTPDAQLMPQANVVGVDVGSAVRIDPLNGVPGKVTLFNEPVIRSLYAAGGGPDCKDLIASAGPGFSVDLGAIATDLSSGVHLLVVEGCEANTGGTSYDAAQCGSTYSSAAGNLSIREQTLTGAVRDGNELPSEVVHLSQALETFRGSSHFSVSFGDLSSTDTTTSAARDPAFRGNPAILNAPPTFDPADVTVYGKLGFRVSVDGIGIIAQQSLADIQLLSSPRNVPTNYYGTASNYVLLMLGAPAVLPDGGANGAVANDSRQRLHFLAVPVVDPKPVVADGGAGDASADAATP